MGPMTSTKQKIENAVYAACETQPSWGYRFFRIMGALGHDFGDPDEIDQTIKIDVLREYIYHLEDELRCNDQTDDYRSGVEFALNMLREASKWKRDK